MHYNNIAILFYYKLDLFSLLYIYPIKSFININCITSRIRSESSLQRTVNVIVNLDLHACIFLYTKITRVDLSVFVYRLFHEAFSPILVTYYRYLN